jgi:hypothetical protein
VKSSIRSELSPRPTNVEVPQGKCAWRPTLSLRKLFAGLTLEVISQFGLNARTGDSARIVEIASHNPGRVYGHVFTVEPRPEAKEMAVPSAPLFSLLHRLIPVIILSGKIQVTGSICKESVKVCTSKSPPSADDSAFDLSLADVFAQCAAR